MAGFEVIVRPAVFPNIRPSLPRVLAPADNPTQGIATINGSSGSLIDLTRTWSASASSQDHKEKARKYDVDRIYQKNDDDTVNKDNFVDVERVTQLRMEDPGGESTSFFEKLHTYPINIQNLVSDFIRQVETEGPDNMGLVPETPPVTEPLPPTRKINKP